MLLLGVHCLYYVDSINDISFLSEHNIHYIMQTSTNIYTRIVYCIYVCNTNALTLLYNRNKEVKDLFCLKYAEATHMLVWFYEKENTEEFPKEMIGAKENFLKILFDRNVNFFHTKFSLSRLECAHGLQTIFIFLLDFSSSFVFYTIIILDEYISMKLY